MKAASFTYHRARQIDEAFSRLNEFGEDAKILAGGQSLMPLMNFRLAQPEVVTRRDLAEAWRRAKK